MMKGRRDAEMIALAKEYGFPRGCPVLWKPGGFIDFRGFFPKFENDEHETEEDEGEDPGQTKRPFDDSVLDNASSLFFFRKWSGFLLQIIAFKIDKTVYWTVCSKNYADPKSVFIQRGVSVFGQLLSANKDSTLLQRLADDHLYLGGELLHVDDEHGYIAKENALIVTCVGMGSFANSEGVKERYSKLVDYYTPSEVVDFCSQHQLMSDTSYTITGTKADLTRFVNSLLKDRDLMRNSDFERIMSENSPEKTAGTADHMKLVGDVLEGFVFHIQKHGDVGNTTVKVKLPFYTWRTFFLRVRLERIVGKDYDRIEGYDFVNKDTLSRIKRFTRRWCFTHAEEFTRLMKCAMVRLQTGWPAVLEDLQACTSEDLKVKGRAHVIVADYVENLYFSESGKELIDRDCQEFDAILTGYNSLRQSAVSICICVGPVGSGKSTFCQRIADRNPEMYELIDGDIIVGEGQEGMNLTVQNLGAERKSTTFSKIWDAIMMGKVPVISTGGKALLAFDKRVAVFNVRSRIMQVFGLQSNIVVVVMRDASEEDASTSATILSVNATDLEPMIKKTFDKSTVAYMTKVFWHRVHAGIWAKNTKGKKSTDLSNADIQFINQMARLSSENRSSALSIAQGADHVLSAPYIPCPCTDDGSSVPWIDSVKNSSDLRSVVSCLKRNSILNGRFQQMRAVVKCLDDDAGSFQHATLMFDIAGRELSHIDLEGERQTLVNKTFEGVRYTMRLHPEGASNISNDDLLDEKAEDVRVSKTTEFRDAYEDCKIISVCHVPALTSSISAPDTLHHITEKCEGLDSKSSVNVIQWFRGDQSAPLVLRHHEKDMNYVFDKCTPELIKYRLVHKEGSVVEQKKVVIRSNSVRGTEKANFKCWAVAAFGNQDAN